MTIGPHASRSDLQEHHWRALEGHLDRHYHAVNACLRDQSRPCAQQTVALIGDLDEIFSMASPVRSPVVVWRSTFQAFLLDARPGDPRTEHAYMSTTVHREVGHGRIKHYSDCLLELTISPGVRAVFIEDVPHPATGELLAFKDPLIGLHERELLLQRGVEMRIRTVHAHSGVTHINATVHAP